MIARPLLVLALACACGSEAAKTAPAPAPAPAPARVDEPVKAEPFAAPKLNPPPPPAGAAVLVDRKKAVYVQRCDADHPCPELLQAAGETHCRALELGGFEHWRLPDHDELKRLTEIADLERTDGFHWSRTADPENAAQVWIFDPKSGQETTIPRTRKPFRVRCVFDL